MKVTGETLIGWGFKPGKWFQRAILVADSMASDNHFGRANHSEAEMIAAVKACEPVPIVTVELQEPGVVPVHYNIDAETDYEIENLARVKKNVDIIARNPVVRAISVMPDACPQGYMGIPVGTVAITENAIIPGMHSADICCSVAISVFPSDADPKAILDAGMKITHFGKGGRKHSHDMQPSQDLLNAFEQNPYLTNKSGAAAKQFGTQGDGNHFFYVGRLDSTGQIALVTHHGSRGPGAMLYKAGIEAAKKASGEIAPMLDPHDLWIPFDTQEGQDYWEALQIIRRWTKGNHFTIHDSIARELNLKVKDRYWNEHNFVFKREFGGKTFFAHAKGATPSYAGFGSDSNGKMLIPLNMANPILIAECHADYDYGMDFNLHKSLGFSPHGAGRNYSRTDFGKLITGKAKDMIADVTGRFDVRAFSGKHDVSEFPLAYKDAGQIIQQIKKYDLVNVVDMVQPLGCIMAGHDGRDYRAEKKAKKERREREAAE